jgi:hypothetical protein
VDIQLEQNRAETQLVTAQIHRILRYMALLGGHPAGAEQGRDTAGHCPDTQDTQVQGSPRRIKGAYLLSRKEKYFVLNLFFCFPPKILFPKQ